MRKIARIFVMMLLGSAVGLLSFGITTILSSAFIQTTAAKDNEATTINDAIRDIAALTPSINPAASAQYESVDYGFTYVTYRVKRGDNLTDVARRHSSDTYKISVEEIVMLNGIKNPNRVLAGQNLRLPMYYAKEIKITVPAIVRTIIQTEVAAIQTMTDNVIAHNRRKWLIISYMSLGFGLIISAFLYSFVERRMGKNVKTETTAEPEKFLTHGDEILALLPRCTGSEIADILESELVEIPRGPGSTATTKVKVKNTQDFMKKHSELSVLPSGAWSGYLTAKNNKTPKESA